MTKLYREVTFLTEVLLLLRGDHGCIKSWAFCFIRCLFLSAWNRKRHIPSTHSIIGVLSAYILMEISSGYNSSRGKRSTASTSTFCCFCYFVSFCKDCDPCAACAMLEYTTRPSKGTSNWDSREKGMWFPVNCPAVCSGCLLLYHGNARWESCLAQQLIWNKD